MVLRVNAGDGLRRRQFRLAVDLQGMIKELDINPLAVLPGGQGVKALDALAVLG